MIVRERPFQDRLAIVAVSALRMDVRQYPGARPFAHDVFIQFQEAADLRGIQFHECSSLSGFRTGVLRAQMSKQRGYEGQRMRWATRDVEINIQLLQILPGQFIGTPKNPRTDCARAEKYHYFR